MKFVFQAVNITDEKKPGAKQGYQKAVVIYTYNGEPRKQTIVSFSNPAIFKQIQELTPGQEIEVDVVKNAGGFNEWKSISTDASGSRDSGSAPQSAATATRVTGSNYETREERAGRQVLIVKQSSLNAAAATLAVGRKTEIKPEEVIAVAEQFKDWVFAQEEEDVA